MKLFTKVLALSVLTLILLPALSIAQLNGAYILSGRVHDDNGKTLTGVTVKIKGTTNTCVTDSTGNFNLTTSAKLPYVLVFTSVGFQAQEFEVKNLNNTLAIQLTTQSLLINEVVVTASRKEEKLLRSPVAIDKLDIKALKQSPAQVFTTPLKM